MSVYILDVMMTHAIYFYFFWLRLLSCFDCQGLIWNSVSCFLSDKETEAAYAIRHLWADWQNVTQSSYTSSMSSTLTFWLNKARRREWDRSNQRKGRHWHLQLSPNGPPLPYYLIGPRQQCGLNHRPTERGGWWHGTCRWPCAGHESSTPHPFFYFSGAVSLPLNWE